MSALVIAVILGIIEGLTEFLPVSSTGHLIMTSRILSLNQESYASFNIIIQLGAILAVVFLYREKFFQLLNIGQFRDLKSTMASKKLNIFHIAVAIFPALSIGYLTRHFIKAHLFNPQVVVCSLIVVGLIMIIIEKIKPTAIIQSVDEITLTDAFVIGLAQCFALIPGVSRSGATMLASMMRKIDVTTSADFSFLIAVPVITIATVYEFIKSYSGFNTSQTMELFVGFIVSFLVAIGAIKGFLIVLKRLSLTPFAYYRIIVGILFYLIWLR